MVKIPTSIKQICRILALSPFIRNCSLQYFDLYNFDKTLSIQIFNKEGKKKKYMEEFKLN